MDGLDDVIEIGARQNIINMQSLIYDQLQSSKFKKMIEYAWFKPGYIEKNPCPFQNVTEVCFSNLGEICEYGDEACMEWPFIKCSHCDVILCIQHFFTNFHTSFNVCKKKA